MRGFLLLILGQKGNATQVNHNYFFSASACTSASLEPSYVLRAIGADEDLAHSSIRYGKGKKCVRMSLLAESDL